jgi:RNA polymerase sigma-70 factor (ECF subfamily)
MAHEDPFGSDLIALIPRLRIWARSLARHREDAEDLVQDTLARAWAAKASFEYGTNLRAWAYRILRNQFLSGKRQAWREVELGLSGEETTVQLANQDAALELRDLSRAIAILTEEKRRALMLVGVNGLTYEDAAVVTGCTMGTVKSRVSRARSELKQTLSVDFRGRGANRSRFAETALAQGAAPLEASL